MIVGHRTSSLRVQEQPTLAPTPEVRVGDSEEAQRKKKRSTPLVDSIKGPDTMFRGVRPTGSVVSTQGCQDLHPGV